MGADDHVSDGVLVCRACGTWFAIQDDLLELVVPELRDRDALPRFVGTYDSQLSAAGIRADLSTPEPDEASPQLKQRRHFDWFAEAASTTYDEYQRSPFWENADSATFARWTPRVGRGAWLLDVGCANGRSAWPFAATNATIVGCDISDRLIELAIAHAKRRGVHASTTFVVAYVRRLPFRAGAFDFVLTYGAWHHLPDPGGTRRDILRIARPGGVHFGSENKLDGAAGVRNPRHLQHAPGTSSAGSAAAVAAGMVPLALGSQTAGSCIWSNRRRSSPAAPRI